MNSRRRVNSDVIHRRFLRTGKAKAFCFSSSVAPRATLTLTIELTLRGRAL
jgi:hypothetical protein